MLSQFRVTGKSCNVRSRCDNPASGSFDLFACPAEAMGYCGLSTPFLATPIRGRQNEIFAAGKKVFIRVEIVIFLENIQH